MKRAHAIALLSGGLDSSVAAALARHELEVVLALTFDYGQRAGARERASAAAFCRRHALEHRVLELPWLARATRTALVDRSLPIPEVAPASLEEGAAERAAAVWVPNRNGLFVAIAAAIAEGEGMGAIIAGFNAEEAATFPDNGQPFIDATNRALALSTRNAVQLLAPTGGMMKTNIARRFVDLALDPDDLWCCYEGGERMCGRCESCARTIRAFRAIGAFERIRHRFDEEDRR